MWDLGVTSERVNAAVLLRRLGHTCVAHEAPDDLFASLIAAVTPIAERLERGQTRERTLTGEIDRWLLSGVAPGDGDPRSHFPDCVVSGSANPMGVAISVRCEQGEAVAEAVLGASFEGEPGRAHGGVVAAIFDDVMGYQLSIVKVPAFAARLTVTYRAPTPIGVPLVFRARVDQQLGGKLYMSAVAHTRGGHDVIAEAEATFIVAPIGQFMPGLAEAPR